ncbi:hypothetical protein KUA85_004495 [Salmonella enterica]|nr:hypothetical protein [Salmonella enterica]EHR4804230.1 hypothetical protein [Salmonella enterica]
MKKTLIALAVAASAVVSGSAMAWTANGGGGQVDIGGTLTPVTKATPWETAIGTAVTNLDAQIQKNDTNVEVNVPNTLPILAIRSVGQFTGRAGIAPAINYGWIGNVWKNSSTQASAEVRNEAGVVVGGAHFPLTAQGVMAAVGVNGDTPHQKLMFANQKGKVYFGGLPTSANNVLDVRNIILQGWPDIADKFVIPSGAAWVPNAADTFSATALKYSSYYGSVIAKNSKINIIMNAPVKADAPFKWKISLPATVTYQ